MLLPSFAGAQIVTIPGRGAVCAKPIPPLVIPKQGLSARNLLAASSSKTADSSRDNAALRNDNPKGVFKLHHYPIP
jgi:hypothetical protein